MRIIWEGCRGGIADLLVSRAGVSIRRGEDQIKQARY